MAVKHQMRSDAPRLISATNEFHESAGKASVGPAGTLESRTDIAARTGDLTSTHAPFPVEYEDFVQVLVAPC
ncbi:hypothetical protein GCM10009540_25290 [Streptomyces turgidiscabies]